MIRPRISASTSGGRGQPPRFMVKPTTPMTRQLIQSPTDAPATQAPMKTNRITPGTMTWPGRNATLATCLLHIISNNATTILASTMVHTMENVMCSSVVSMSGPGLSPTISNALSRMAVPRLPGMPKATVGISEPPLVALLAASGAITPRISPLPNMDLSLALCTAWP